MALVCMEKKQTFIPLVLDEANKNTPKNRMMWQGISLVASSTIFPQMFFFHRNWIFHPVKWGPRNKGYIPWNQLTERLKIGRAQK